jgi:hypothetical protein
LPSFRKLFDRAWARLDLHEIRSAPGGERLSPESALILALVVFDGFTLFPSAQKGPMARPIPSRRQMPRDSAGNRLRKSFTVITVPLDRPRTRWTYTAQAGSAFSPANVEALLEKHSKQVKEWFGPERKFRMVELANGDYSFVEECRVKIETLMGS